MNRIFKMVLIGTAIVVGLIVVLGAIGVYYFKPDEQTVLNFLKENPDRTSLYLIRNDTILASQNPNKKMPLASTVKIVIAIEYAEQAAQGAINPNELVPLEQLEKYYVPNTDGNAHPTWLKAVENNIVAGKISIREIAKGMIKYSSNANTEWLMERLGLDKINSRLMHLGLKDHGEVYYLVSSLFIGKEAFPKATGTALKEKLRALEPSAYIAYSNVIHQKLATDTAYKNEVGELGMDIQKVWSDNLPRSTAKEYVSIMRKINRRDYFSPKTQEYLDEVMEYIMENPVNREWLEHSGMKGGSTAFVLTKALYATNKKGNQTELAYFMNDLTELERTRLEISMNEFELKLLTDVQFRQKVKESFTTKRTVTSLLLLSNEHTTSL